MQTTIIATVTPEGNIELPPEVRERIQAGERFLVTLTEDTIILKKANKFDWNEWEKRLEEAGEDPEKPSLEEISEIVKEIRRNQHQP